MNASWVRSRASASLPVSRYAKLYVALPYWSIAISRNADASGVGGSIGLRGTPIGISAFGSEAASASRAARRPLLAAVRRGDDHLGGLVFEPARHHRDVAQVAVQQVPVGEAVRRAVVRVERLLRVVEEAGHRHRRRHPLDVRGDGALHVLLGLVQLAEAAHPLGLDEAAHRVELRLLRGEHAVQRALQIAQRLRVLGLGGAGDVERRRLQRVLDRVDVLHHRVDLAVHLHQVQVAGRLGVLHDVVEDRLAQHAVGLVVLHRRGDGRRDRAADRGADRLGAGRPDDRQRGGRGQWDRVQVERVGRRRLRRRGGRLGGGRGRDDDRDRSQAEQKRAERGVGEHAACFDAPAPVPCRASVAAVHGILTVGRYWRHGGSRMNSPLLALAPAVLVVALAGLAAYAVQLRTACGALRRECAAALARHAHVLRAAADGIYVVDEHLRVAHVNAEAERLLRASEAELRGRRLDDVAGPLAADVAADVRTVRRTGESVERTHASGGSTVELRVKPAGRDVIVALRDVSERARAEARVRAGDQRVRLVTQHVDAVLWTTDRDARFTSVSGGALADLGLRAEHLIDQPSGALIAEHVLHDVVRGAPVRAETARGQRWLRHHVEPLRDGAGEVVGAVGVTLDVTELKRTQQELFESAHRDRLTRLPNRLSIDQRIEETIADARRDDRRFALLFVDLDRFKTINDTLSHAVGDDVLREVALRLQETLRAGDVIARPGGDEFIILVPRIVHTAEVESVAQRLVRALAVPVVAGGRELFVNASVGAAIFPDHGHDAGTIVGHADAAMYRAKGLGGSRFALYDESMEAAASERLALENDLRHAILRDELALLYQPVVAVATRRIAGCEALLRWQHPVRGLVSPAVFIPIAEESGAIVALHRWVLRQAFATAARVRAHQPEFRLAVNFPPRDLREPD